MQRADVKDIATAFAAEDADLTAMKLQKLVYYAQAWHLARFGEPAFDDEIQAWSQGPVVRKLYALHRGLRRVGGMAWGDARRLPESVGLIVELVRSRYGALSGDELSRITHRERPWRAARGHLPEEASSEAPIDLAELRDFHRQQGGRRSSAMLDALASVRLEGGEPTPQARALAEAVVAGRMSAQEALARTVAAHRR